jgi:hypothetical protein
VWDNHKEDPRSILDEYATVYLFFQWMYLQSRKDPNLFRNIIASKQSDYQAVTEAVKNIRPEWNAWGTLLRDWMAANYINSPSGIYGYMNDPKLKEIKVRAIGPNSGVGLKNKDEDGPYYLYLFPGEGVYSKIKNNFSLPGVSDTPKVSGPNIRYAGLQKSGSGSVSSNGPYSGNVLLTYNTNTILTEESEKAYLTGENGDEWPSSGSARHAADFPYPLRIDARDLPGQGADYLKSLKDGIMVFNESN